MSSAVPAPAVRPPRGRVALRLPLFATPGQELRSALKPPWPRWMRAMYQLEEASNEQIDVDAGEVTASAALSTLSNKLRHRLEILAFVAATLEELGWDIELVDDALIATAKLTPYLARHQLEEVGVAGPMSAVSDLDASGWPRMWYGGDD